MVRTRLAAGPSYGEAIAMIRPLAKDAARWWQAHVLAKKMAWRSAPQLVGGPRHPEPPAAAAAAPSPAGSPPCGPPAPQRPGPPDASAGSPSPSASANRLAGWPAAPAPPPVVRRAAQSPLLVVIAEPFPGIDGKRFRDHLRSAARGACPARRALCRPHFGAVRLQAEPPPHGADRVVADHDAPGAAQPVRQPPQRPVRHPGRGQRLLRRA